MLRRRVLAAAASLALVPLLAACGGSTYDITQHQLPSGNGAFVRTAAIYAQNVVLVADLTNTGRYSLAGTWVNLSGTDDKIIAVAADGANDPNVIAGLPVTIPALGSTLVGGIPDPALAVDNPSVAVPQIVLSYAAPTSRPILPGRYMNIRIAYSRNGVAHLHVLVVPPVGMYSNLAPLPAK